MGSRDGVWRPAQVARVLSHSNVIRGKREKVRGTSGFRASGGAADCARKTGIAGVIHIAGHFIPQEGSAGLYTGTAGTAGLGHCGRTSNSAGSVTAVVWAVRSQSSLRRHGRDRNADWELASRR